MLAGDESAWRTWYVETYAQLEAYIRWPPRQSRDWVDDVLQETWMITVQNLRRFNPEAGSFQAWLNGIAVNVIRNALTTEKAPGMGRQSLNQDIPANTPSLIDERERSRRIALALDALPQRYEMVLRAKYLDQQSVAAIAAQWGESEKAIESLLSRARSAFRDAFNTQE